VQNKTGNKKQTQPESRHNFSECFYNLNTGLEKLPGGASPLKTPTSGLDASARTTGETEMAGKEPVIWALSLTDVMLSGAVFSVKQTRVAHSFSNAILVFSLPVLPHAPAGET